VKVLATVVCPVCGQLVKEAPTNVVMLSHTDGLSRPCPMSGQPFGGCSQGLLQPMEVSW
jgi:hypothetical protein